MDITLVGMTVLAIVVSFAIGYGLTRVLGTCKEKKHSLFYVVVALTFIYYVYLFVFDKDYNAILNNFPEIYVGVVVLALSMFAFFFFIYKWSKNAYYALIVVGILYTVVFGYEFSLFKPLYSETEFAKSISDVATAVAQDFFKFGLLIGAKYKFLK